MVRRTSFTATVLNDGNTNAATAHICDRHTLSFVWTRHEAHGNTDTTPLYTLAVSKQHHVPVLQLM